MSLSLRAPHQQLMVGGEKPGTSRLAIKLCESCSGELLGSTCPPVAPDQNNVHHLKLALHLQIPHSQNEFNAVYEFQHPKSE